MMHGKWCVLAQATVLDDSDVLEAVNVDNFPGGGGVAPAAIFGNSIVYDGDGEITAARAMMQVCVRAYVRARACVWVVVGAVGAGQSWLAKKRRGKHWGKAVAKIAP